MDTRRYKEFAKRWLPPALAEWLQTLRQSIQFGGPEWEYLPGGWATVGEPVKGWDVPTVSELQKEKWPDFVKATEGPGLLGVNHEAPSAHRDDYYAHHLVMAFGYVLTLASRGKDPVSLLDWGGGIGHYYVLAKRLLPDVRIDYTCKELPLLCEAGQKVLPDARFIERDEDLKGPYDLVMASGALQCVEDWRGVVRRLASLANPYVYITRLPIVHEQESFVALQRVYAYGYGTEYRCWFLNGDELVQVASDAGLQLVREFIFHRHPPVRGKARRAEIQGYLFRKISGGG